MKNSKTVKDIPLGILMLVLSQFIVYGVSILANFPKWYELLGIMFGILISMDLITYGVRLIRGHNDDSNK